MKFARRDILDQKVIYLPNKKFKTIELVFLFVNEVDKNRVNERNFLSEILLESTKKYYNAEKLNTLTDYLYNLDISSNYYVVNNLGITTFFFRSVNDKYLNEKGLFEQVIDLAKEVVYNPKTYRGMIPKRSVSDLKSQTEELILSINQNKPAYSYYQFIDKYTKTMKSSYGFFPNQEKLAQVTSTSVTETYKKMIEEDEFYIFVSGDFDFYEMDALLSKEFAFINQRKHFENSFTNKLIPNDFPKEFIEENSTGQTRVFLGFNLDFEINYKNNQIMNLFDEIFGGFEKSKLFSRIREELHLSYYVYSNYLEDSHLFLVSLEVAKANYQLAIEEVKKQLKLCQEGDISDELFHQSKQNIIKALSNTEDSQVRLLLGNIINYIRYNKQVTYQEKIDTIKSISKQELLNLIQKIILDTIYVYTSEDTNEKEINN